MSEKEIRIKTIDGESLKIIGSDSIFDNDITEICDNAFWNAEKITSVEIPNGIIKIGDSAFHRCDNLTSVSIPKSVTDIGSFAFWRCDSLKDVYYQGNPEEWNQINILAFNEPLSIAKKHFFAYLQLCACEKQEYEKTTEEPKQEDEMISIKTVAKRLESESRCPSGVVCGKPERTDETCLHCELLKKVCQECWEEEIRRWQDE